MSASDTSTCRAYIAPGLYQKRMSSDGIKTIDAAAIGVSISIEISIGNVGGELIRFSAVIANVARSSIANKNQTFFMFIRFK